MTKENLKLKQRSAEVHQGIQSWHSRHPGSSQALPAAELESLSQLVCDCIAQLERQETFNDLIDALDEKQESLNAALERNIDRLTREVIDLKNRLDASERSRPITRA